MGHRWVQELPEPLHPQQVVAKRLRFGGGGAGARCRVFGCLGQGFSLPWRVSAFFWASPHPWHSFPCSGWIYWPGSQDSLLGVQPILQVVLVVETNGHQVLFSQKRFKRSKRLLPALAHISRCFLPAFAAGIVPLFGPAELSQGYFLPSEVPAGISWKPEMLLGAEKLLALARTARAEHHPSEMLPLGCSQPHPCRGEGSWAAPLELLLQPNTSLIQINLGRKRIWADFHPGKEINPCMLAAISPCPARSKAALCRARTCG